jgi:hypothetical protein
VLASWSQPLFLFILSFQSGNIAFIPVKERTAAGIGGILFSERGGVRNSKKIWWHPIFLILLR